MSQTLPDKWATALLVAEQVREIAEGYRYGSPLSQKGEEGLVVSLAFIGTVVSKLSNDASELEQRQEIARLLTGLPDKARRTMAEADVFWDAERAAVVRSVVTENAINRFKRFTDLAAKQVTRTFTADGAENFYALSGIASTVNQIRASIPAREVPRAVTSPVTAGGVKVGAPGALDGVLAISSAAEEIASADPKDRAAKIAAFGRYSDLVERAVFRILRQNQEPGGRT